MREDLASVAVQTADFDLSSEVALLRGQDAQVGAVVSFVGLVRDWLPAETARAGGSPPSVLELEHYPGMTESAIAAMVAEARRRFAVRGVRVIHRVGRLAVGEQIVLVAVASSHRAQAFQACEFLMDWLKTDAPFWKKEVSADGARWVEARTSDDEARARWD